MDHLHEDALTITGKTIGENVRELEAAGFFKINQRGTMVSTGGTWCVGGTGHPAGL